MSNKSFPVWTEVPPPDGYTTISIQDLNNILMVANALAADSARLCDPMYEDKYNRMGMSADIKHYADVLVDAVGREKQNDKQS